MRKYRCIHPVLFFLFVVFCGLVLISCGGGSGGGSASGGSGTVGGDTASGPGGNAPAVGGGTPLRVAGTWEGALNSTHPPYTGSTWCAEFAEVEGKLSGRLFLDGVLAGNDLAGLVSGSNIQFGSQAAGNLQFSGVLTNNDTHAGGAYTRQAPPGQGNWFGDKSLKSACGAGGSGGGGNPSCANIAGKWNYTSSGTVTCTGGGETTTEYPSGSGMATINQNGCNVSWIVPGTTESRSGTVSGNTIKVSGIFVVPLQAGVSFTQNIYSASGTISADSRMIRLNGSGAASGTVDGTAFSCSGSDVATFNRASLTSQDASFVKSGSAERQPRLFLNNSLQLYTTVLPVEEKVK
ncbi:MAG: hypothetical protein M0Z79_07945 [Nitrospiraceae bacterium]|nr:hypothetical protein [Nitrospiraceae bacterium]